MDGQRGPEIFIPPPSLGFFGWLFALMGFPWGLLGLVVLIFGARSESGEVSIEGRIGLALTFMAFGLLGNSEVFRGPTLIRLGRESIAVQHKWFGLVWTRTMDTRDLANLRAHYSYNDEFGAHTAPGISVDHRGRERRLGEGISREEAEYLVSRIKEQYPNLNVRLRENASSPE
ncbi:MAG TPA: hypothetical protein VKZ53_14815 [Candidatus Angelobacter sp.]|nr:hypothetical protein [Candidatus Angelobacter sp.]